MCSVSVAVQGAMNEAGRRRYSEEHDSPRFAESSKRSIDQSKGCKTTHIEPHADDLISSDDIRAASLCKFNVRGDRVGMLSRTMHIARRQKSLAQLLLGVIH